MRGFLAECQDQLRAPEMGPLREYLAQRFGGLVELDLEVVLTDLDNSLSGLGGTWFGLGREEGLLARQVNTRLLEMIRLRLTIPAEVPSTVIAGYDRVLSNFSELDSLITFNYDCGLEAYTKSLSRGANHARFLRERIFENAPLFLADLHPYGPAFGSQPHGWSYQFLKLHGSLDYIACSNGTCPMRAAIHVRGQEPSRLGVSDYCPVCGADMETVIVPPTLMKSFERYPKLSLLWRLAIKMLRASDKLVFWGFSCPTSDHHVSWLLRYCRTGKSPEPGIKEVTIIDPKCSEVEGRLRSLLDPTGQLTWTLVKSHEDYVSSGT